MKNSVLSAKTFIGLTLDKANSSTERMAMVFRMSPLNGLPKLVSRAFIAVSLCAVFAWSPDALAKNSVFLNGVNIDGVTNQKFKNVTVVIDGDGNILITAKGYKVKKVATTPTPVKNQGGPVSRRYFLVSETNLPGMVQYDLDIFVNSVWVKRVSHEDAQTVTEVSKYLRKGKNTVHITATKTMTGGRRSASAQHYLKVIIGEGNIGGNNVMIDNPIVEYKRKASEVTKFSDEFSVTGR